MVVWVPAGGVIVIADLAALVTPVGALPVRESVLDPPLGACVFAPVVDAATVTVLLTVTVSVTVLITSCSGAGDCCAPGPGASPRTTETGADARPMRSPASLITDQVSPAASTIADSANTHHMAPRAFLIGQNLATARLSAGKACG